MSNRELEILKLISDGLSNYDISQKLILSSATIKWYNRKIFNKLGVKSRTQAVRNARELGLLGTNERKLEEQDTRQSHVQPLRLLDLQTNEIINQLPHDEEADLFIWRARAVWPGSTLDEGTKFRPSPGSVSVWMGCL